MKKSKYLVYDGRKQTLLEWAEEFGIKPKTLWHRIEELHWPVEKALTTRATRPETFKYKGKYYTVRQLAQMKGTISPATFRRRIRLGWDIEKIMNTPLNKRPLITPCKYNCFHCPFPDCEVD